MAVLLAAGANPNMMRQGMTPLCWAVNAITCRKCCALLLAAGALVDDIPVRTPLWNALSHGHCDLVKMFFRAGARDIGDSIAETVDHRRDASNEAAFELRDAIRAGGGWAEYVVEHRRVLSGLVSKLSPKRAKYPRPIPLDAASHVVAFWCPPGGH